MSREGHDDPFAVLGLPARPGLSDDEVRSAWRRVAAATHPDRADGGDPARFAGAAGAYTTLRTSFGRSEALADLAGQAGARRWSRAGRWRHAGRWRGRAAGVAARAWHGRPVRLALRLAVAAAVAAGAALIAGPRPATPAVVTGVLTWLVLTARRDLAPPR